LVARRTLALIKPDAVHNFGKILHATTASGFVVNNLKMTQLTPDQAAEFYGVHRDKPFFECVTRRVARAYASRERQLRG
jgi:nucleoside-diphosphate kinase